MKRLINILIWILIILSLSSCNRANNSKVDSNTANNSINDSNNIDNTTNKDSLSDNVNHSDFIYGADISSAISLEESSVTYKDYDGDTADICKVLSDSGINYIRVRVWNNPYNSSGNGYGGGNCDVTKAAKLGKRAADNGMKLLVDFHYSDFWADPAKQKSPKAWVSMSISEKSDALYSYTKDSLETIIKAGADIGMVQIGNETTGGLAGENDWNNICTLMSSGIKAVDDVSASHNISILSVVHFTDPQKSGLYEYYAKTLNEKNVDYDVFATSYYPYWHSSQDNLKSVLSNIVDKYNKKVMVAETSYTYSLDNSDSHPNTISKSSDLASGYEASIAGQSAYLKDLVKTVKSLGDSSLGVFYWEPGWIPVGSDYNSNHILWEKYGSGWASSYSSEYDPDDAGKWFGGCAVENQALFGIDGKPLDSLKAFTGK